MLNVSGNLITKRINTSSQNINTNTPNVKAQSPVSGASLLEDFLKSQASINTPIVKKADVNTTPAPVKPYKNDLRTLFTTNSAVILAFLPRIANSKDTNGNEYIDMNETPGTFKNAVERLDQIKAEGFNTLHILPINPPGKSNAQGTGGSVYAPEDILKIDPILLDKKDPRPAKEQFKSCVDECHNRGLRVMVDLPSCASYDLWR